MDTIKINSRSIVSGTIKCGGAKNLATKLIVASMLTRGVNRFTNVPKIYDIYSVIDMCSQAGALVEYDGYNLLIDSTHLNQSYIMSDRLQSRISVLYLGVFAHFFSDASVPLPMGCDLGLRTIDLHASILTKFGFSVRLENNFVVIEKQNSKVKGVVIDLPYPSVGATETAIFLAVLAEGKSVIRGVAIEPEINSLILFLQQCGACIRYSDDRELMIEGVDKLYGCDFHICGDRVEAVGWACMACSANGNVEVEGIDIDNLQTFLGPFMSIGGGFKITGPNKVSFFRAQSILRPIFLETGPYPMFSTDYQPMIATLMMQANGSSIIHETLFSKRLDYLATLESFGAKCTIDDHCYGSDCRFFGQNHDHSAIITGVDVLKSPDQHIIADTIRSGFAYLIAASAVDGITEIRGMDKIKRGFADIEDKLKSIGVDVIT